MPDRPGAKEPAAILAPAPVLALVAFAAGVGFHLIRPVGLLPGIVNYGIGGVLLAVGLGVLAWGLRVMHGIDMSPEHADEPPALITTGPFRYSRNPLYLGVVVVYLGLTAILDSAWPLAPLAVLVCTSTGSRGARRPTFGSGSATSSRRTLRTSAGGSDGAPLAPLSPERGHWLVSSFLSVCCSARRRYIVPGNDTQILEIFSMPPVVHLACAGSLPGQLDGSPKIALARSGELGTVAEIIRRPVRSRTAPHRRRPFRRGRGKAKYRCPWKRAVGTRLPPEEP